MGEDYLAEGGLYVDEITKKLELIDPERASLTESLLKHVDEFQKGGKELITSLGDVVSALDQMETLVDIARKQMIGTESALLLESTYRQKEERELTDLIRDKTNELERRKAYIESLIRQKNDQLDLINKMKN